MQERKKVLFVCIHNSARSQMAEAFLQKTCDRQFETLSAGLEPGTLNPLVVRVMKEVGIDISGNETRSVGDILNRGESFDHVITVCDEANAERCPVLPGPGHRHHWGFPDPSVLQGSEEERLSGTRRIRDQIFTRIREWCEECCDSGNVLVS
jgi:arsenate reductase